MRALLLRIYLSENDMYKGKSAHHAVLEFLKKEAIAGATAYHCIEGYGAMRRYTLQVCFGLGQTCP